LVPTNKLPPSGAGYLPDGAVDLPPAPLPPRSLLVALLIFMAVFVLLQWGWEAVRGTALERLVVDQATVMPAAGLVRWLTPAIQARAVASSIKAPGGGINILNGCEGVEVMFLLLAALAAVRISWRRRLVAILLGLGLVFALNQARIVTLFYAFRADRQLFDLLHTTLLPVVLVALTAAYFYAVIHQSRRGLA
jgi:exosortase/archaeosortase family protein